MDKELKTKWVAALRSGEYKQGRNRLKWAGRYCCLGVLCEVAGITHGSRDGSLPGDFAIKQKIGDHQSRLQEMNDDDGKSFAEIADYIEAKL